MRRNPGHAENICRSLARFFSAIGVITLSLDAVSMAHAAAMTVALRTVVMLVLVTCALSTPSPAASIGKARIARSARSSFDTYTRNPNAAQQQWMRDHYARLMVFDPYFDARLSWFPNAWAYEDLYAIYVNSSLASEHPEWILRDAAGRALYIRYDCSSGTCPQYAADIGNPAFRSFWIDRAAGVLAAGYRGLFIDDVNMRIDRVSDGNGNAVAPRDPRTGTTMTETSWRRYMAEFTEQIRAAFPSHEIVHNALWFVPTSDPYVQRQIMAADVFCMERGVNDSGIVRGTGQFGFETFLGVIDWVHQRGRGIWLLANASSDAAREYGLAAHLLVTEGKDYGGNVPGTEPDNWWPGFDVDLGNPLGVRTRSGDLFQREFEAGRVVVNQPGAGSATVQLGAPFVRLNGASVTSVTLGGGQGVVLRRAGTTSTAAPSTSSTSTTRPSTTSTTRAPTTTTRPPTSSSTSTTTLVSACPPGLPDADADGRRDTCDPCTSPAGQERARLTLWKLRPPANDDRLKLKGYFTRVPPSPAIDPVTNGIRLLVSDARGATRIDVPIPGGAYDREIGAGWRRTGAASRWQYRNSGRLLPRPGGIEKVKLRMFDDPAGRMRVDVKGKNGNYRVDPPTLPLVATLVLDPPLATSSQCAEARFPGPAPELPSCTALQDGNTIDCR